MGFSTTSYKVSKESDGTLESKLSILEIYPVGDLLCVLRSIEDDPKEYDEAVIKKVYKCLYDKNIMCV